MRYFSWTTLLLNLTLLMVISACSIQAQSTAKLKITVLPSTGIEVEGSGFVPTNRWSFRNAVASSLGLGERVVEFRAYRTDGHEIETRKVTSGEYRSELYAGSFNYKLKLSEPPANEIAHVSSLSRNFGVLMLRDLLPQGLGACRVEMVVPAGWSAYSSNKVETQNSYQVVEGDRTVFLVGRDIRRSAKKVDGVEVELVLTEQFPVKDELVMKSAEKIFEHYVGLTGQKPTQKVEIIVAPLRPGRSRWQAETIGSSTVLFIDKQAKFSNWRGQFGVIFTHELFHFWVPNALRLEGEYDWFFEGFTIYTAALTALELKLISFQEYLDTIARVYDSYLSYPDFSLLDASDRRWLGNGAAVYDKGMLVAFLYDLMVRRESHSTKTVTDLYRPLFAEGTLGPGDANEVIIRLLTRDSRSFSRSYIDSAARLEFDKLLPEFGLRLDSSESASKIRVAEVLTAEQKRLLKSLGHRN
jgi:hypothetical protein